MGSLQWTFESHLDCITLVAFLPDGTQLAPESNNKTIKLQNAVTRSLQRKCKSHFRSRFYPTAGSWRPVQTMRQLSYGIL